MCAIAHEQHEQGEGRRESLHVDISEKDFNAGVLVLQNLQSFLSRPFSRTAKLASINVSFLMCQRPYRAPTIVAGAIMRMLPQGA